MRGFFAALRMTGLGVELTALRVGMTALKIRDARSGLAGGVGFR